MGPDTEYRSNVSTIALVRNGKSNSNNTRHITSRYFFISDRIMNKEISVDYVPTGDVIADLLTKPLQGTLFKKLKEKFLN